MAVFERIQYLAKKRGKSVKDVARELGFGESTIYKWKVQSPKGEYLEKIADYFGVSVDYLLGRTDSSDLTPIDSMNEGPGSDLAGYFRINTANINPDDAEEIEEELKDYLNYLVSKVEEKKKRKK